jgi:hypothetical protein
MAAVLACGRGAVLSHISAAELWEMLPQRQVRLEVSVPPSSGRRRSAGIVVHRRAWLSAGDTTRRHGIPATKPIHTLIDLAGEVSRRRLDLNRLEAAINEADNRGLTDPERLRQALDRIARRPGVGVVRRLLDRRTFRLTRSGLERRFLPIARAAGLPVPQTREYVNGFEVDFFWPELRLIVESDSLRYRRTPAKQARIECPIRPTPPPA